MLRRGADKSLAFPIFLFAAQPKEFFLNKLKKSEQRSHKCLELKGEYVEQIHFFNTIACFLYKAKDLSAAIKHVLSISSSVGNVYCREIIWWPLWKMSFILVSLDQQVYVSSIIPWP
jgi:hypothetical protein